jgi:hypothetical protein
MSWPASGVIALLPGKICSNSAMPMLTPVPSV